MGNGQSKIHVQLEQQANFHLLHRTHILSKVSMYLSDGQNSLIERG